MTVTVSKPALNLREELSALKKPTGIKGEELLRANTAADVYASLNPVMFRNRIINGAMTISQRATSSNSFSGGGYQTLDRWNIFQNLGALNIAQSSTAPAGFSNSMQFTVSTAASQTSSSSSIVTPNQSIEGFNFYDLGWGTGNAKPITVSVWVYSSLIGQYAIWIRNSAADRFYATSFTITTANAWQQITATIPGDTSGTWVGSTNGIGATVGICLAAGSGRVGAGNTWSGSSFYGVTGQVDWQATASNTFYFTGFQLEKGTVATPFEYRQYTTELQLCQRYFYSMGGGGTYEQFFLISSTAATDGRCAMYTPVSMRTVPTIIQSGSFQIAGGSTALQGTYSASTTMYASNPSTFSGICNIGFDFWPGTAGSYGVTNAGCFVLRANGSQATRFQLSAEL
jgi:hypothetical protein